MFIMSNFGVLKMLLPLCFCLVYAIIVGGMQCSQKRILIVAEWLEPGHLAGINRYAGQSTWLLHQPVSNDAHVHVIREFQPHGIICQLHPNKPDLIKAVKEAALPTVELCNAVPSMQVPRVMPDVERECGIVANHFVERGFTRLVYIGNCRQGHDAGFARVASSAGVEVTVFDFDKSVSPAPPRTMPDYYYSSVIHDEFSATRRKWAGQFLSQFAVPVGVYVRSLVWAVDIIEGCRKAKTKIPEQVAIVLGADTPDQGASFHVPLTGIVPDYEEQGYQAAGLLDRMMQGEKVPKDTVIGIPPLPLVPRASTMCPATANPALHRAVTFLMRNLYDAGLSVKQVCLASKLSRSCFYAAFQNEFKMPVAHYIEDLRLREAKRLLATTSDTSNDIAARCGFGDTLRFRRALRRATGMTPGDYRRAHSRPCADAASTGTGRTMDRESGLPFAQQSRQRPESRPEWEPRSMEVKILRLLVTDLLGKKPIALRLGHRTVSGRLNKVIRTLLADRAIEPTIPHKPNSRLQQYRLTAKGRRSLYSTGCN